MNRVLLLPFVPLTLAACAIGPNEVRVEGLVADFKVEKLSDDVFFLTLSGPGALKTYRESLNQPFDERARMLCGGRDFISSPFTEYFGYRAAGAFGTTAGHLGVRRMGRIACKEPAKS